MNKQQLRKQFIAKREQLSPVEYDDLNERLLQQFQQLDLSGVRYLHLFIPIRERKEPDTFLIRSWLQTAHPHIRLVFPRANFSTSTMQNFADDEALQLARNTYGITEPVAGHTIATNEIDMVLLPLLAFDQQGYRVGYGKGFYDRFLSGCKPGTSFIGLSFFNPVERIDDVDGHDVKMHACITPGEVIEFR